MAYNPFPIGYQPYTPQMMQQAQVSANQQAQNPGINWIQGGEATAKAYLTAPNTIVPLWDSEEPVIYIKNTDANGIPSITIVDYTVRSHTNTQKNVLTGGGASIDYATKTDLQGIYERLAALEGVKNEPVISANE